MTLECKGLSNYNIKDRKTMEKAGKLYSQEHKIKEMKLRQTKHNIKSEKLLKDKH